MGRRAEARSSETPSRYPVHDPPPEQEGINQHHANPLATSAGSASVSSVESPPVEIRRLNNAAARPSKNSTHPIPIMLTYSLACSVSHPKKEMPASDVAVATAV